MVVVNMMCGTGSCYQVTSSDSCCGDDRISSLPESVMSHILSRLPTKEAVQTCVLSTDWKYKWTSIYNVSINDHAPNRSSKKEIESDFFDFMEKMSLLCFSHNVRSFSLWCFGYYDFARMSTWISAVLGPKLETFQLLYAYEGFVIPKGLLNCTSLKTLQLMSRFTFKFPAVHNFPNLVHLHLDKVNILLDNEDSSVITSSTMILKFPVLKSLKLRLCKWLNVKIVEIHAPALTELSSESDWKVDDKSSNYYSIKVVGASRLSKFLTEKGLHDNFIFTGGSKVDFAAFNSHTGYELDSKLYGDFALQVRRLLNELSSSSINYLMLSTYTAEAIAHPNPELPLPRYDKLERLDIQYDAGKHDSLLELLHSAPFLKILHVDMHSVGDHSYDDVVGSYVPSCIVSSLLEVNFKFQFTRTPELHLAKFLMENGKELKKVYLLFYHNWPKVRYVNRLSKFAKASAHLQVVVDYKTW